MTCKLSGMVTEVRDPALERVDCSQPYVETALEAFGAERVLFGTDWPVCLLRCGYATGSTPSRASSLSSPTAEQRAIMGENAARIYRL